MERLVQAFYLFVSLKQSQWFSVYKFSSCGLYLFSTKHILQKYLLLGVAHIWRDMLFWAKVQVLVTC